MARAASDAIAQTLRGIGVGLRSGKGLVFAVTGAVFVFNLVAPVAILSVARRPPDFITFNPWLSRLPEYLASEEPWPGSFSLPWCSARISRSGPTGGARAKA